MSNNVHKVYKLESICIAFLNYKIQIEFNRRRKKNIFEQKIKQINNVIESFRCLCVFFVCLCMGGVLLMRSASIFEILRLSRASEHFHPAVVRVFAVGAEKVNMIFEAELEHELFLDSILETGWANGISNGKKMNGELTSKQSPLIFK